MHSLTVLSAGSLRPRLHRTPQVWALASLSAAQTAPGCTWGSAGVQVNPAGHLSQPSSLTPAPATPRLPNAPAPGPPRTTGALVRAAPARPLPRCSGRPAAAPTFRVRRASAEPPSHVCPTPRPPPELAPAVPGRGDSAAPGAPPPAARLHTEALLSPQLAPPASSLRAVHRPLRSPPCRPPADPGAARLCLSSGPFPSGGLC